MTRENRRNGLTAREAAPGSNSTFARRKPKPSKRSADPVTPEVYAAVAKRAGGRCEVGAAFCSGRMVWHHRLPVGKGGPSTVVNGLYICTRHHDLIHNHPAMARDHGHLLRRYHDPATAAVLLASGDYVKLLDDGGYQVVEP